MKVILLAFGLLLVLATKSQADEPGLATASVGLEAAVKSANAVMVVRFVNLGSPDLGGPGETIYQGAEIEVISAMKGVSEKRIPCTFRMRTIPFEQRESLPEIGLDYVIAGSPSSGDFEIGKLLSATPENIALVKAIIGSQPSMQSTRLHQGKLNKINHIQRQ